MGKIARIWRGVVRSGDADEYGGYIEETGFAAYATTPGNRGSCRGRRAATRCSRVCRRLKCLALARGPGSCRTTI